VCPLISISTLLFFLRVFNALCLMWSGGQRKTTIAIVTIKNVTGSILNFVKDKTDIFADDSKEKKLNAAYETHGREQ